MNKTLKYIPLLLLPVGVHSMQQEQLVPLLRDQDSLQNSIDISRQVFENKNILRDSQTNLLLNREQIEANRLALEALEIKTRVWAMEQKRMDRMQAKIDYVKNNTFSFFKKLTFSTAVGGLAGVCVSVPLAIVLGTVGVAMAPAVGVGTVMGTCVGYKATYDTYYSLDSFSDVVENVTNMTATAVAIPTSFAFAELGTTLGVTLGIIAPVVSVAMCWCIDKLLDVGGVPPWIDPFGVFKWAIDGLVVAGVLPKRLLVISHGFPRQLIAVLLVAIINYGVYNHLKNQKVQRTNFFKKIQKWFKSKNKKLERFFKKNER